jgi:selenocysteine lyase/cysteine desulfurase
MLDTQVTYNAFPLSSSSAAVDSSEAAIYPLELKQMESAEAAFKQNYPAFESTVRLDKLRATEYTRLDAQKQVYLDYTGGGLYATCQLHEHMQILNSHVFGNPHSSNPTSHAITELDEQARAFVLRFFNASPDEYVVVFTPNASGALRLVGEAYPFSPDGHFLYSFDNHNSVNGIRAFASAKGSPITAIPLVSPELRLDGTILNSLLVQAKGSGPSLFAYPAQSNFTGAQHSLHWIKEAQMQGWDVLLDAASFVPTNRLDLSIWHPDFVPISFYKMFGYPTGVGCLLIRKTAMAKLQRPWFAGGTIKVVSVQGNWHSMAEGSAAFEDGTINYLNLPAVEIGLKHLLMIGMETIHVRVMCLTGWLLDNLLALKHRNGQPLVQLYGPPTTIRRGGTIALNFLTPDGHLVDERLVEQRAAHARISLRTGCFCNPGAGEAAFSISKQTLLMISPDHHQPLSLDAYLNILGLQNAGAIRISPGLVTNFADVYHFLQFAQTFLDNASYEQDFPPRLSC